MEFNLDEKQRIEKELVDQNKKRNIFRGISILALVSSPWNLIVILFGVVVAFDRFSLKDKVIGSVTMITYAITLMSYFIFKGMYDSAIERLSKGDFQSVKNHCFKIKIFFVASIVSVITMGILMYMTWIQK